MFNDQNELRIILEYTQDIFEFCFFLGMSLFFFYMFDFGHVPKKKNLSFKYNSQSA